MRKTENYLEKDSQERVKHSWVEELESTKSNCTRQKLLVRQHGESRRVDKETTLTGGVAAGTIMTLLGPSHPEAKRSIGPIVPPKRQTIISSRNVRTMAETTWAEQVAKDMKEYEIKVLGIGETRWKGTGSVTLQSVEKVVYVENDEEQRGEVAITMRARAKGALMEWTPIRKRIITARFYLEYKTLTVVKA